MSGVLPPADVSAGELFLTLCEFPAPQRPLKFRFSVAPDEQVHCRAVSDLTHSLAWTQKKPWILVADALVDETGKRLFPSPRSLLLLDSKEFDALLREVDEVHEAISPFMATADDVAWERKLLEGAIKHQQISVPMGACVDFNDWNGNTRGRPDRYFGCAPRELLYGHRLVYRVSRELLKKSR